MFGHRDTVKDEAYLEKMNLIQLVDEFYDRCEKAQMEIDKIKSKGLEAGYNDMAMQRLRYHTMSIERLGKLFRKISVETRKERKEINRENKLKR